MSSPPQTNPTPMNISPQNIAGVCNNKCAYSFDYPVSSCTATNSGNSITLSYTASTPPVIFNTSKYNINACYISCPSLHLFNNVQADAEILIYHTHATGGNPLYVCIPISTNGTSNAASTTISETITAMSNGAPSQGESISQGITDFTINNFIPMKEFYSYSGSPNVADFIAFGMKNAIFISQTDLTTMKKIISPINFVLFQSGPNLYVNPDGPTNGTGAIGDDIYIDCQPTNSSEEETNEVVSNKAETSYDVGDTFKNIVNSPYFLLILFSIAFVILLFVLHKGLVYLTGGSSSISNALTGSSHS